MSEMRLDIDPPNHSTPLKESELAGLKALLMSLDDRIRDVRFEPVSGGFNGGYMKVVVETVSITQGKERLERALSEFFGGLSKIRALLAEL